MYLQVNPYQELLEGVMVALQVNEGIIKLSGRDGSGKSALCRELCRMLNSRGKRALYFSSAPTSIEDLQNGLLEKLALTPSSNFTKVLTRFLLDQPAEQRQLYVIFDEAQAIDARVLDGIRMLCNIQDERRALVSPIICGSPDLDKKLHVAAFRSIAQYLSQGFTLNPMSIEQLTDFYWAYWRHKGVDVQPPTATVINNLFKAGQGRPGPAVARLELAYQRVMERREGREPVEPQAPLALPARKSAGAWLALCFGSMLLAGGAGMYYLYQNAGEEQPALAVVQVPASQPLPAVTEPPVPVPVPVPEAAVTEKPKPEEPEPEAAESAPEALVSANEPVPPPQATSVAAAGTMLSTWIADWQAKDTDRYLRHYDAGFEPADGNSRDSWEQQRRGSIGRAEEIRISYDSLEVIAEDDSSLTLQFWLHYSASNYADDTLKELVLIKAGDGLLIRNERNLLVERAQ
jgi:hypothetical protein